MILEIFDKIWKYVTSEIKTSFSPFFHLSMSKYFFFNLMRVFNCKSNSFCRNCRHNIKLLRWLFTETDFLSAIGFEWKFPSTFQKLAAVKERFRKGRKSETKIYRNEEYFDFCALFVGAGCNRSDQDSVQQCEVHGFKQNSLFNRILLCESIF